MSNITRLVIMKRIIYCANKHGNEWYIKYMLNSLRNPEMPYVKIYRDLARDFDTYDYTNDSCDCVVSINEKLVLEKTIRYCWKDIIYHVDFSYPFDAYSTLICSLSDMPINCGLRNSQNFEYLCHFDTFIWLLLTGCGPLDNNEQCVDNFDLALNNYRVSFNVSSFVVLNHLVAQMLIDCDIAQTVKHILIELFLFPIEE